MLLGHGMRPHGHGMRPHILRQDAPSGDARRYSGRSTVMPGSTTNLVLRARIETMIRIASPLLNLVLLVGDRVSRVLEPDDPTYVPARMPHEGESAPRGLRPRPTRTSGPRP